MFTRPAMRKMTVKGKRKMISIPHCQDRIAA